MLFSFEGPLAEKYKHIYIYILYRSLNHQPPSHLGPSSTFTVQHAGDLKMEENMKSMVQKWVMFGTTHYIHTVGSTMVVFCDGHQVASKDRSPSSSNDWHTVPLA